MHTLIVHDIELLPDATPEDFERYVTGRDYVECGHFPSLMGFTVVRVGDDGRHYRELIHVRDADEFAREMTTERFAALARDFDRVARVTGETVHPVVGDGYAVGRGHVERGAAVVGGSAR